MLPIKIIPENINVDFMKRRFLIFSFSILIVLSSIISYFFVGLNYGIDFKGGYLVELTFNEEPNLPELRKNLSEIHNGEISLQQFGKSSRDIMIRLEKEKSEKKVESQKIIQTNAIENFGDETIKKVKDFLGEKVKYHKIEVIGPKVGGELIAAAIKAVLFSLIGILLYIAFRFEWQFSVCGIIALFQDCIALIGAYSIFQFEFNEAAIVALLTTASYSINDTIVIFDRIRENIKRYKKLSMSELINKSINETISRTVLTAGTTLVAILAMCIFGGKVIRAFSLPILIGIGFGTFSSIALSAPLLIFFKIDKDKLDKKKGGDHDNSVPVSFCQCK